MNPLIKAMSSQGLETSADYHKKHSRPGQGTVERYMMEEQDPITGTGNWRAAPLRMAECLNVDVEILFPEAAECRQDILDNPPIEGKTLKVLEVVRCPNETEGISLVFPSRCKGCKHFLSVGEGSILCSYESSLES